MDWLTALWIAVSGIGFVVCVFAEGGDVPSGRYLYVALFAVCLIAVALRAFRFALRDRRG